MAAFCSLTLSGTVTGLPEGTNTINVTYSNSSCPGIKDVVTLTVTPTALTIPANTLFVLIVPPTSNSINILVNGDTNVGAKLHPTQPTLLAVPASSPSVFLASASSTISNVQIYYL